jgi:signal transduction histidine kinase/CheY-like chemotaxis protein
MYRQGLLRAENMNGLREQRVTPLGGVMLSQESDIVTARQRARQISELVGLHTRNQARLATAVSELARNAFQYGSGGRIDFSIDLTAEPQVLWADVIDRGPGISNLPQILSGAYQSPTGMGIGLIGTRRLMDYFEAHSQPGLGTHVRIGKTISSFAHRLSSEDAETIRRKFLALGPVTTAEDLARQNKELAYALDSLRSREVDLQTREAELQRLSVELDETNRGVVALYAELDEKAAALRRADEMKSRILWHVSHEFRTPVGSILALSQLLLRETDGPLLPEQETQVEYIRQAAAELAAMVNDLLDLARVDAGMSEAKNAPVHVDQFLGSLRGMMRPLLTNEDVTLVFQESDPDLILYTDETKLGQILRNLISNALKFTQKGEVRVTCSASDGETPFVEFTVSDTGIGIAPENLERIFEEFSQLDNPIQKHVKGTGLGLPLSRKLAHLLGGTLRVTSQIGQGTTFVLTLPMLLEPADAPPSERPAEPVILVIDDEPVSRYIAVQLFRGSRYRILEASGGAEGAERARFEHPALILLDLIMPDRTGFEVLKELKADPETAQIPVVVHTSINLTPSDWQRLADRHLTVLPKLGGDRLAALTTIRDTLQDPSLFKDEPEFKEHGNVESYHRQH